MYMNMLVMTDKSIWGEDAMEFKPERYFNINPSDIRLTYIPFSYGPRSCIGRNFAEMEMVGALATILKNFKLGIAENQKHVEEEAKFTLGPKNPIKLLISVRE
jgi:cytochrome P450